MFTRQLKLTSERHLFLFGARNTAKSTLIEKLYDDGHSFYIDLLEYDQFEKYNRDPNELKRVVEALDDNVSHVIIDEIQKLPKLLDTVQLLMRKSKKIFIMTGSSARKLKHGGANLLAGRAFVYDLYPLTAHELSDSFDLDHALQWGTLPNVFNTNDNEIRREFLKSYAHTYLKEEVWDEHMIRELNPFRRFLEVAAQCNGKIINYANIARDVGTDDKTIQSYYSILEDTLIGFFLESYQGSFRKRLSKKPKFYFFDTGIVRALARLSSIPLAPQTNAYGNAFEHFIILECIRHASYARKDFRFNYLRTSTDAEIDLVVERPGLPLLCIEIKSATHINPEDISSFKMISKDVPNSEAIVLSNEKYAKKIDHIMILPWQQGLQQYFID